MDPAKRGGIANIQQDKLKVAKFMKLYQAEEFSELKTVGSLKPCEERAFACSAVFLLHI